jgi:arylsulfatase A-like enzyme
VPFVIYDPERVWKIKEGLHTLANVAPTIAALLGLKPYDCWEESLLE